MRDKLNISDLIKGCLLSQPYYQRALVDQYSGLLFVICKRYLGTADAQDALQESLMRIFKYLEKFDAQKGNFESWISTIAIRQCLSKIAKKNLAIVGFEEVQNSEASYDIEGNILAGYDTEYLIKMIGELPDSLRVVFNMAAIDGYPHKEIAGALNISVISSRTRLNRAKNILKEKVLELKNKESWVNTI